MRALVFTETINDRDTGRPLTPAADTPAWNFREVLF
jgi:hypothetical protein